MSNYGTTLWQEVILVNEDDERVVIDAGDVSGGGLSDVTQRSLRGSGKLKVDARDCELVIETEDGEAFRQIESWAIKGKTCQAFCVGVDRHDIFAEAVVPVVDPVREPVRGGAPGRIALYTRAIAADVFASRFNILLSRGWREFGNAAGTGALDARWSEEQGAGMDLDAEYDIDGSVAVPDMSLTTTVFCPLGGYTARFVLDVVARPSATGELIRIEALDSGGSVLGSNTQAVSSTGPVSVVLTLHADTHDVRVTYEASASGTTTATVKHPTLRLDSTNQTAEY